MGQREIRRLPTKEGTPVISENQKQGANCEEILQKQKRGKLAPRPPALALSD